MWRAVGLMSSLAVTGDDGTWLTSTLLSLLVVLAIGGLATLYMYAGRYFRWFSRAEEIRLTRTFRVAFGALFLAAALLPYLLAKAPLLAVAAMSLALVALVPIILTQPEQDVNSPEDTLRPEG